MFDGLVISGFIVIAAMGQSIGSDDCVIADYLLIPIFSFLCICAQAAVRTQGRPSSGVIGHLLSSTLLQKYAVYAYALYMLHTPSYRWSKEVAFWQLTPLERRDFVPGQGVAKSCPDRLWIWWFLLPLCICHVVAVTAHHVIQEPSQRMFDAFLRG
jgi:peptidoglycan/LPS O-acetylase OafA/YrhL